MGHYMKYSAQYIRSQLAKYITKYIDAVQVVGGDFLQSKGLTVEDYLMHISQPTIDLTNLLCTWFPGFVKNILV